MSEYKLDDSNKAAHNFMQWFTMKLFFKKPNQGELIYKQAEFLLGKMLREPYHFLGGKFDLSRYEKEFKELDEEAEQDG